MSTETNPTHAIPLTDGAFICDNTTLETATTCPRSFQFYKFLRRERSAARSALKFGGILHEALEVRYRAAQTEGAQVITPDLTERMIEKVREGFVDWNPLPDEWRTYDLAVKAILHYSKEYPIEDAEIISVERPFLKPLGTLTVYNVWARNLITEANPTETLTFHSVLEIPVLWAGRLDVILRKMNRLILRDHKTTSMMGPTYFDEYDLSSQFHGYCWALGQELGELPAGYEINALGIRKPTRTGVGFEYTRKYFSLDSNNVNAWVNDTLQIISTLFSYASESHFPRHTKHCQGKYGACQYKIVCSLGNPEHQEIMLSTGEYQDVVWSPLNDR